MTRLDHNLFFQFEGYTNVNKMNRQLSHLKQN